MVKTDDDVVWLADAPNGKSKYLALFNPKKNETVRFLLDDEMPCCGFALPDLWVEIRS